MGSSKIEELVNSLEQFEIAFLLKYRLNSLMKPTKNKIIAIAESKGISLTNYESIIKIRLKENPVPSENQCPRCTSEKYFAHKVEVDDLSQSNQIDSLAGRGKVAFEERRSCIVCGLPHEQRTMWSWKQFFKFK